MGILEEKLQDCKKWCWYPSLHLFRDDFMFFPICSTCFPRFFPMLSPCFPRFSHTFNGRSPSFTGRAERARMVRPAVQLSPEEISHQRLRIGGPFQMGVSDECTVR